MSTKTHAFKASNHTLKFQTIKKNCYLNHKPVVIATSDFGAIRRENSFGCWTFWHNARPNIFFDAILTATNHRIVVVGSWWKTWRWITAGLWLKLGIVWGGSHRWTLITVYKVVHLCWWPLWVSIVGDCRRTICGGHFLGPTLVESVACTVAWVNILPTDPLQFRQRTTTVLRCSISTKCCVSIQSAISRFLLFCRHRIKIFENMHQSTYAQLQR